MPESIGTLPCDPSLAALVVVVVDDQATVRAGVERLLRCGRLPVRAVWTASNTAEALALISRTRPDVVVLDADLGGEDGLAIIPLVPRASRVLVLSSCGDAAAHARAALLGAVAFVDKHEPAAVLLARIAQVATPRSQGEACHGEEGAGSQGAQGPSSAALQQRRS